MRRLRRFVRQEIAALEATGDLRPGELEADDVIDLMLLRALREFVERPSRDNVRGWLLELAREQLEAEVRSLKEGREETASIEEDIPETPPEVTAATLGEEILYFHEPEEDLKLEGTRAAGGAAPGPRVAAAPTRRRGMRVHAVVAPG